MIESYLHQLSDDWGPTLFYWVHVTLSMRFFLQEISVCYEEYSSLWNVWHPISGKFLRILQRHWDSESGHNQSNCYEKKICDFWRTKNHHFPIEIILSNHRIPSKKPWNVQKKHVPNRMMILNDPIQSKLWLLWSNPI